MVRTPELEVAVACIPVRFRGIGVHPAGGYVPIDIKVHSYLQDEATGAPIKGEICMLLRSIDCGKSWGYVGEDVSDAYGDVEVTHPVRDYEGTIHYMFRHPATKYCFAESISTSIEVQKKATAMGIGTTRPYPTPTEPFTVYGHLRQIEPEEKYLNGKTVKLYESGDGGATWTLIATLTTYRYQGYDGWWEKSGIKKPDGKWLYYAEFEGDAEHLGCSQPLGTGRTYGPVYF